MSSESFRPTGSRPGQPEEGGNTGDSWQQLLLLWPQPGTAFLHFLPQINILCVICDPAEMLKLCGTFSDLPVWFHLLTRCSSSTF